MSSYAGQYSYVSFFCDDPYMMHVSTISAKIIKGCKTRFLIYLSILPVSLRSSLQSVRDSISNQVSAVFQLYEQNTDSLDLPSVTERSATAPSLSDMLEWLQDAERHYRQQYPFCSSLHWIGFALCLGVFFFPQLLCSDS